MKFTVKLLQNIQMVHKAIDSKAFS